MLNRHTFGEPSLPPLLIVHGLFGSGRNWGVIAKRLSDSFHVTAPDLRNHGDSPWFDSHSYEEMAADLSPLAGGDVIGHSMGGKAAMMLALTQPHKVRRLIVADIAPVSYGHSQVENIHAMQAVDLTKVTRRSDAADQLAVAPELKPFLLQSLDSKAIRWKLNLNALETEMDKVLSFPKIDATFDGPTLFLSGENSDYVQLSHRERIKALFPNAKFAKLRGVGHWLHAEKPREFEAAVRAFLTA